MGFSPGRQTFPSIPVPPGNQTGTNTNVTANATQAGASGNAQGSQSPYGGSPQPTGVAPSDRLGSSFKSGMNNGPSGYNNATGSGVQGNPSMIQPHIAANIGKLPSGAVQSGGTPGAPTGLGCPCTPHPCPCTTNNGAPDPGPRMSYTPNPGVMSA
jgi:hypothetical protein